MYPSSSSSSSHGSMGSTGAQPHGGLTRYVSAPGSFLTTAVDSVVNNSEFSTQPAAGKHVGPTRFFSSDSSSSSLTSESKTTTTTTTTTGDRLQRSYRLNEFATAFGDLNCRSGSGGNSSSNPSPLVRHSSSPAGFLHALSTADNGFSFTRGTGSYNSKGGSHDNVSGISRLNSQLSFTRPDSLPQISEESEDITNGFGADGARKSAYSYATASFGMGSWDDSNSIMFSSPQNKRAKSSTSDAVSGLDIRESQVQFGLSQAALEAATMEKLIEIPHDSVPCKIRAKRGCATHPRSIAERERRTRISGKLKKLQDLVPNMDKQTSYADMLDLAVQHIKGLQTHVQNLNNELENCACGCKKAK